MEDIFNLIRRPWLPVRRQSGALETVTPWQITAGLKTDPILALAWPRPDFNGAALEFLIGLLSTAAPPRDEEDWRAAWDAPPSPEALRDRFETVAHAFDLDGPGPRFLQDMDPLDEAEDKPAAALLIDAPGAQTLRNNADLFVKRGGAAALGRPAAAMALFTLNAFAPSGGAGHRTSLRGGGPMTTLLVAGDSLWARLWPNVETTAQAAARSGGTRGPDDPAAIFPWLGPTRASNPKTQGRPTTPEDVHPLQVYWGMPRRIRLDFQPADGETCGITGQPETVMLKTYRTRNYGTDYSEGFLHPLTPYYRTKEGTAKLPVHPQPGGIGYRHWPGLVVRTGDRLRDPAQTVRQGLAERRALRGRLRVAAFGYDMDNMKARAWIESEMPVMLIDDADHRELAELFVNQIVNGAGMAARLLTGAVKSALFERPTDAPGDFGFIGERFWRATETDFYTALTGAAKLIGAAGDEEDDPTVPAREDWAKTIRRAALRLFDDLVPIDPMDSGKMGRHVKARVSLAFALSGRGKAGQALFGKELDIAFPAPSKPAKEATPA